MGVGSGVGVGVTVAAGVGVAVGVGVGVAVAEGVAAAGAAGVGATGEAAAPGVGPAGIGVVVWVTCGVVTGTGATPSPPLHDNANSIAIASDARSPRIMKRAQRRESRKPPFACGGKFGIV